MHNRYKKLFYMMLAIMIMDARTLSHAASTDDDFDALFNDAQVIDDEELDEMRGGFITRSGVMIDFSFTASTLVDGELINQVILNTADKALSNIPSLRNIIQIGEENSAFNETVDTSSLPNIMTVIQNNVDDLTLQQINLLDLSIKNFDNYILERAAPEVDFQNTLRIH